MQKNEKLNFVSNVYFRIHSSPSQTDKGSIKAKDRRRNLGLWDEHSQQLSTLPQPHVSSYPCILLSAHLLVTASSSTFICQGKLSKSQTPACVCCHGVVSHTHTPLRKPACSQTAYVWRTDALALPVSRDLLAAARFISIKGWYHDLPYPTLLPPARSGHRDRTRHSWLSRSAYSLHLPAAKLGQKGKSSGWLPAACVTCQWVPAPHLSGNSNRYTLLPLLLVFTSWGEGRGCFCWSTFEIFKCSDFKKIIRRTKDKGIEFTLT